MDQLERECRSYTRYLVGQTATGYVIEKYLDFHRKFPASVDVNSQPFDHFLVEFSARGRFSARLADTYVSRFRKHSALRKKLVLTLAILETVPPSFQILDKVPRGGRVCALLRLGFAAIAYTVYLLLAIVFLAPAQIAFRHTSKSPSVPALEQ